MFFTFMPGYPRRMSASQRRLLDKVATPVLDAIIELSPRIVELSKDKHRALGIAETTLLVQVGAYRALAIYPADKGGWTAKEFDSESGSLSLLREITANVNEVQLPAWVLRAAIESIEAQLAGYTQNGYPNEAHEASAASLGRVLAKFRQRLAMKTMATTAVKVDDDEEEFDYAG